MEVEAEIEEGGRLRADVLSAVLEVAMARLPLVRRFSLALGCDLDLCRRFCTQIR